MGLVQIEQSELDTLRKERDDARAETATAKAAQKHAEDATEAAEAAKATAETAKDAAEAKVSTLEEQANRVTLKDQRMKALSPAFVAKLGEFTKGRMEEQAGTLSEEDWDAALKEREESHGVKRDAPSTEDPEAPGEKPGEKKDPPEAPGTEEAGFKPEELARLSLGGDGEKLVTAEERGEMVGSLSAAFKPAAPAAKS